MSGLLGLSLDGVSALDRAASSWGVGECARLVFFRGGILKRSALSECNFRRKKTEGKWEVELQQGEALSVIKGPVHP